MASAGFTDAFKAHPGYVELPGGSHSGYCQICGGQAELNQDWRSWSCDGGCDPKQARQAVLDWYEGTWKPAQKKTASNGGTSSRFSPTWPKLPGHDADLAAAQKYLTDAGGFPEGCRVDRAVRPGPNSDDPLSLWVRQPGRPKDIRIRFPRQADVAKPAVLRSTLVLAMNGRVRMRQPSVAQAIDFLTMSCVLATLLEDGDPDDEARAWLDEYIQPKVTQRVFHQSISDPEQRFDALQLWQGLPKFDRVQANRFVRRELPPDEQPALLLDEVSGERWVRAGEFLTYLRHVYGLREPMAQPTLDARMEEIGVQRIRTEVNRAGLGHVAAVLYRLNPEEID